MNLKYGKQKSQKESSLWLGRYARQAETRKQKKRVRMFTTRVRHSHVIARHTLTSQCVMIRGERQNNLAPGQVALPIRAERYATPLSLRSNLFWRLIMSIKHPSLRGCSAGARIVCVRFRSLKNVGRRACEAPEWVQRNHWPQLRREGEEIPEQSKLGAWGIIHEQFLLRLLFASLDQFPPNLTFICSAPWVIILIQIQQDLLTLDLFLLPRVSTLLLPLLLSLSLSVPKAAAARPLEPEALHFADDNEPEHDSNDQKKHFLLLLLISVCL